MTPPYRKPEDYISRRVDTHVHAKSICRFYVCWAGFAHKIAIVSELGMLFLCLLGSLTLMVDLKFNLYKFGYAEEFDETDPHSVANVTECVTVLPGNTFIFITFDYFVVEANFIWCFTFPFTLFTSVCNCCKIKNVSLVSLGNLFSVAFASMAPHCEFSTYI